MSENLEEPSTQAATTASAQGRRREDAHHLELERQLRAYLTYLKQFPPEALMKRTVSFVEDNERILAQLDRVRERRGKQ